MHIETKRLKIREFEFTDWKDVLAYTSDPKVMKYMPEEAYTEEKAKQFVRRNNGKQAENFAVFLQEESKIIGHIVFHPWFGEHTYEIGWIFHADYQNKGYATEAASSVMAYAFHERKIHRIVATCQPENSPSYRVMEKLGMRREGYFLQCIPREDGTWWDEYYYAMLCSEWRSLTARK